MKLTCLGTASGIATKTRFHNMVLLESCGHGLLLDGGEPLSTLLIRHGTDLNEIDGMVITHLHSDHAGALPQLIQTMQISRRDKVFQVLMPSEGTHLYKDFLNMLYLFDSVLPFHLKIEGIQCGAEQEIGVFSIESISNAHLKRLSELAAEEGLLNQGQSYSIAIHCEGKRIVYSGDIKSVMELRPLLREETDLLILEMAHFMPDDFLRLLEDVCPRMTVFTHFHPDLDIEPEKKLHDLFHGSLPSKIIFANDGMELEI